MINLPLLALGVAPAMYIQSTCLDVTHSEPSQEVQALLKQSEERFRTLVANIPGAVYRCVYDPASQRLPFRMMVFLSAAIENISGYCPSDFINHRVRSFTSIIHPQDRARVEQALRQAVKTKQPYVIEYRIMRADGSIAWVYDKGQCIFCESGERESLELSLQIDGVMLDITDRKQAEADLHGTQAFLNSVVENLPVGVLIKDALDLRVMYCNKASEELFGYTREEVLGKNDYDFLPPAAARELSAQDRLVLARGKLQTSESSLLTPHQGERYVRTKKVPLLDETGIPRYLLAICEDITESKQAEAALRESENHYLRILETASEGIWMFDVDSKTTFANSRIAEMLGYTVEEMLGRSLFDFMDAESQVLAQVYVERRRQGINEQHDFKFRRQDGSTLWAMVSATPILNWAGEFVGVLRMITDITGRKQAEKALQASHQELTQILERITDAFFALDHQWQFTYLNGEAERFFGQNRAELQGASFWDAFPEATGTIVEQQYHQASAQQIPVSFETYCAVWDKWLEMRAYPCAEGLSLFWRDITEHKQAEKALQDSEQRFRATFDQAAVGIAHINLAGEFLRINQKFCNLLGYTQEEMLTQTFQNITHPDDLAANLTYVNQLLSGEITMYSMEKRYITCSGMSIWVNLTVSLKRSSSSGLPKYFISVVQDISDQKQAEAALRQSEGELRIKNQQLQQTLHQLKQTQAQLIQNEKMISLGQMVAGIAHEINNPVSFIYGNVAHAREYASDLLRLIQLYNKHYPEAVPEIQKEIATLDLTFLSADFPKLLDSMKAGASRIRNIVLSLRNFSRLDEAEKKKVDIHEGIDSALLILQHRLKKRPGYSEIQVMKEYGQLPLVECYASQLNQVFMNLLTNAIDALEKRPEPRTITIKTEVKPESRDIQPSHIVVRISDNGLGISEEVKQRIFDPFFTTKPIGVGTGLGLSICHSIIVEKHGGQLNCHSIPGAGTEFTIELPLRQTLAVIAKC